ncbi:MarR family winged helix-turn-helix transcriptional regulator [Paracoccus aminovorans]|uniref:MarR family winged helix-turn-helix transcriptional regulator n=1 Tax=Paracoccus aminovorans TaxID=34004 RepID=UPI002B25CE92|nr:MarR family transcriptional regulator [Paracoccus aminovorans]
MAHDLTLEDQLCFSLYATSMAINRLYKPLLDQLGITYPQYLVLSVLWEEDGRGVGAIATRLDLEPSTITPLVKRLEAAGLVTRTRRPDDERSVSVALTPRGAALKTESRCLGEALFTKAGMAAEEMIALNSKVRDLHDALTSKASAT